MHAWQSVIGGPWYGPRWSGTDAGRLLQSQIQTRPTKLNTFVMDTIFIYILSTLSLALIAFNYFTKQKRKKLPPSPLPSLPLFGHLHLLRFPLHRTYKNLSQKLGPIFSLRFGSRLVVVVSSPAIVEECFTTNDVVLANRPQLIAGKYIGYNYRSVVLAPYGDYWRNLRRLTTVEVFSSLRLNAFQSIRADEVKLMLKEMSKDTCQEFGLVEIRPLLSAMTFNNIMRMVAGKRYFGVEEDNEEAKEFRGLLKDIINYSGISNPADFFPLFRWVDYQGFEKNLSRLCEKVDVFLQRLIDEHRLNKDGNTLINHLLSLVESEPQNYSDETIKSLILVMLLAGTDTAAVTVEWAMAALLNHPEKMDKARAEIEETIGCDRVVNEADMNKLPYLQSIISETYRLFPATPLLVPHESSVDCKIAGYDIPRGTILQVNAWAIHRDPTVWDDAERFEPERFDGGDVKAATLLPFGMGRRSCPGNGLAQRVVGLALGSLIQCFDWRRVDESMVDLVEGQKGVSISKAIPLEAMCRARPVLLKVLASEI